MTNHKLLTRDDFREAVFERDKHRCVVCGEPAKDAHHIIERRLWPDGGYYLNNGASVCEKHHIECEQTIISVKSIRELCGITKPIIPPHLYDDHVYDKWGNIILQNGSRLKGELFYDESVQKILRSGGVLDSFTDYVKYPRTHHLPWSKGITDDDRIIDTLDYFQNKEVVVTEKMDGENCSMYCDHIHARSIDGRSHPSQDWVKNFWSQIRHEIPQGWRICGENLYAEHSIHYYELPTYFMGFSIWNDKNVCLSWKETMEYFELFDIHPVPILFQGIFDEQTIRDIGNRDWNKHEGYVLRLSDSFEYKDFRKSVAKFVRKDHVSTVDHWRYGKPITPNDLK